MGRPRPRGDRQARSKDFIFNRIAASEGTSHGFEIPFSENVKLPVLASFETA